MNDVAVSLLIAFVVDENSTNTVYLTAFGVKLLNSKSVIALTRLNKISDKMFSSNVSRILGIPVTVKTNVKWTRRNDTYMGLRQNDYPDENDEPLAARKYKRMLFYYCIAKYQSINPWLLNLQYFTVHYTT